MLQLSLCTGGCSRYVNSVTAVPFTALPVRACANGPYCSSASDWVMSAFISLLVLSIFVRDALAIRVIFHTKTKVAPNARSEGQRMIVDFGYI